MPPLPLIAIFCAVLAAAALTVGLLSLGGPGAIAVVLPLTLLASLALHYLRR